MNTLTKNQRLSMIERKVDQLEKLLEVVDKPVLSLNQLDQSVFNGLDKQWQWAAVDEDNECFVYVEKPWINNKMTFYWSSQEELKIGDNYDSTNWTDSLIERKSKTLDQSVFNGFDNKWKYAAIDENGKTHLYEDIPKISNSSNLWVNTSGSFKLATKEFITSNWKDSLIEREAEELTDSELTKDYFYSNMAYTLLTNGSKYVVVYVSDTSEEDALRKKEVEVIESVDVLFNDTNGGDWKYVVPINNQGEPLTASEVGL